MYFYNYFIYLCNEKDVAPSRAAVEVGLSKTAVNGWKTGKSLPTDANLQLLASYFEIPVENFYQCDDIKEKRFKSWQGDVLDRLHGTAKKDAGDDEETMKIRQMIRERPEVRMLFEALSDDVPASEILTATAQILRYKERNDD